MMAKATEDSEQIYALIGNIPAVYHSSNLRSFFSDLIEAEGFDCFHFRHRPEGQKAPEPNVNKTSSASVMSQLSVSSRDSGSSASVSSRDSGSSASVTSSEDSPSQHCQQQLHHETDKSDNQLGLKFPYRSSSMTPSAAHNEPEKTQQQQQQQSEQTKSLNKTCCIVKMKQHQFRELMQLYHRKQWLDGEGNVMPSRCFVSRINIAQTKCPASTDSDSPAQLISQSNAERTGAVGPKLTQSDLDHLKEMQPPAFMPNGNVGTPTKVFLELIKACKLPPKIVGKLGLTFSKSNQNRIYSKVKYKYSSQTKNTAEVKSTTHSNPTPKSTNHQRADRVRGNRIPHNAGSPKRTEEQASESEEDADDCEEWERHEALHDDPANYERNKERVYEEPLEVVWEKGGPGLVWYTDEKYWREQEGDFDEQTADDWDVDMSVYYEPLTGGDMDSRQLVTMRRESRRRKGVYDENDDIFSNGKIGKFEKHTKGIGRKVMESQGWTEGSGLGAEGKGMAEALDNDGQKPRDKTGFGYHGEKINPFGTSGGSRKRRDPDEFIISTVYDNPEDMEIPEKLLRRTDHNRMKYRQQPS